MSPLSQPSRGERLWHLLALLALGSLIAVYGLQHLIFPSRLSPTGQGMVFALQSLPLLVCLPTLLKGSARGAAYVAFLAMPYFVVAILTLLDPAEEAGVQRSCSFLSSFFLAPPISPKREVCATRPSGRRALRAQWPARGTPLVNNGRGAGSSVLLEAFFLLPNPLILRVIKGHGIAAGLNVPGHDGG